VSKPPVRYEPVEQVEDDYGSDDYDSDEDAYDVDTDDESDDYDEDDESEDEDADEDGNLKGFVVPDKNESDSDDNGGEESPAVPVVKKRRT
jgi:hypothetical protein